MIKKIYILSLFFVHLYLHAQTNYVHYTVKDGLPQMQCMTLFQDSKGYIWIGTKGGVSKYDGIKFQNFTVADGLPKNRIYKIIEDSKGHVWVLTDRGLSMFQNDKFIFYPPLKPYIFINSEVVIDKNDVIWLTEGIPNTRLIRFENGKYQTFYAASGKPDRFVTHLSYDAGKDKIYFSLKSALTSQKFEIFHNQIKHNLPSNQDVFVKYDQKLVLKYRLGSSKTHLALYRLQNKDTLPLFSFDKNIEIIKRLNDSTFVFTTQAFKTHMPLYFVINGKLQKNPKHFDYINDILQDTENNLWLASEKGLYKLTPFNNFTRADGMLDYVWSVVEDNNGKIWFSSYGNPYLYYMKDYRLHKYPVKFNNNAFFFGAARLQNGKVLFPFESGVYVYDGKKFTKDFLKYKKAVFSVFEDTVAHKRYFGTFGGLVVKDNKGLISRNERFVKDRDEIVLAMTRNRQGELWFVSRKSYGIINRKDTLVLHNDTIKGAMCLYCDYKNNLWIGSDRGLFLFDYKHFIKIKHPELQTMIGSVKPIDSTHFVYGGLRGIGIFDLKKFYDAYDNLQNQNQIQAETFVDYYTQSHGFFGEEVGQAGIFKDSKGRVWVPTNNNVVMFHPKDLKKNFKPPYTYLTKVQVSKDNINWQNLPDSVQKLNYDFDNVRFTFTGISHTAPDMVKYKYRLKGFGNNWSKPTKERYVTYTNLPPGDYTFELVAGNNNNVWNKQPVRKHLMIMPAWWQQMWFKATALLVLFLAMLSISVFMYKRKIKKAYLSERLNRLQLQSVQSQLYPHLLFNAVSAAGSVIYKEDKHTAYDFVVKLSEFMRKALNKTTELYHSLQDEIEFVKSYLDLQKIRFAERFDYEIFIDKQVDLSRLIPQMTLQTYVENAVKYGLEPLKQGGKLRISIQKTQTGVQIIIEDNGIGIEQARKIKAKGTGKGIQIMNEIYQIHNQNHPCQIYYQLVDLYALGQQGTRSVIDIVCQNNKKTR